MDGTEVKVDDSVSQANTTLKFFDKHTDIFSNLWKGMSDLEDTCDDSENLNFLTSCTWEKISSARYNDGVRAGGSEESEDALQHAFTDGFHAAFRMIGELTVLRGTICAQIALRQGNLAKLEKPLYDLSQLETRVIEKLKASPKVDVETLLMDISSTTKSIKNSMDST